MALFFFLFFLGLDSVGSSYDFASVFERKTLVLIFLLRNHLSHDTHFFTRQNMETLPWPQEKTKFLSPQVFQIFDSKHGFPENYSFWGLDSVESSYDFA